MDFFFPRPLSLPNTAVFGHIMQDHKSSEMSKPAGFSVLSSFSHLCNTEIWVCLLDLTYYSANTTRNAGTEFHLAVADEARRYTSG